MNSIGYEGSREQIVKTLVEALTSIVEVYQYSARPKHIAWANDLVDKVNVGTLQDRFTDSGYAEHLRNINYTLPT